MGRSGAAPRHGRPGVSATRMTNATDGEISGSLPCTKITDWFPCVAETVGRGSATCQLSPVRSRRLISCPRNARFSSSREATRDGALARARADPLTETTMSVQRRDDDFLPERRGSVARRLTASRARARRTAPAGDAQEHHNKRAARKQQRRSQPEGDVRHPAALFAALVVLGRRNRAGSTRSDPARPPSNFRGVNQSDVRRTGEVGMLGVPRATGSGEPRASDGFVRLPGVYQHLDGRARATTPDILSTAARTCGPSSVAPKEASSPSQCPVPPFATPRRVDDVPSPTVRNSARTSNRRRDGHLRAAPPSYAAPPFCLVAF